MENKMTDILVVVDAQNGFCHPKGVKVKYSKTRAEKRAIRKAVVRIRELLRRARTQKLLCVFLCGNSRMKQTDFHWDTEIHKELSPKGEEPTFWRNNPDDDPFLYGLEDFLKSFSNPRLILCGFLGDCCVERTALMSLKRKIPVSFVFDCTYPSYYKKRRFFLSAAKEKPWSVDVSLVCFVSSTNVLSKTTPVPH